MSDTNINVGNGEGYVVVPRDLFLEMMLAYSARHMTRQYLDETPASGGAEEGAAADDLVEDGYDRLDDIVEDAEVAEFREQLNAAMSDTPEGWEPRGKAAPSG